MKKYVFRVYTTYDPEDGFNAWVRANSRKRPSAKSGVSITLSLV